jgi:hypothetical protein
MEVPTRQEQARQSMRHGLIEDFEPMTVLGGVDELRDECFKQSRYWKKRDEPAMSALFDALYCESLENQDLRAAMQDSVAVRHLENNDLTSSEVAGVWRATLFGDQLVAGKQPQYYTDRSQWLGPIREVAEIVSNPTPKVYDLERAERLQINLIADKVGTNPYTRAAPTELLMQALAPRFPDGYRELVIGCSMLADTNQILYKSVFPFEPVEFFTPPHGTKKKTMSVANRQLTAVANRALKQSHLVDWCLAVDLTDPFVEHAKRWSQGALRGSELANPAFRNTYDGLASRPHPNLTFKKLDLTTRQDTEQLRSELGDNLPNIVEMGTIKHQLSRQDRTNLDLNCASLLADGGLLVTKDFAYVSPDKPKSMQFYKHWHIDGRYRTFVLDPKLPRLGWQEIFRARDSRCRAMTASAGKLMVEGSLRTIDELLLQKTD